GVLVELEARLHEDRSLLVVPRLERSTAAVLRLVARAGAGLGIPLLALVVGDVAVLVRVTALEGDPPLRLHAGADPVCAHAATGAGSAAARYERPPGRVRHRGRGGSSGRPSPPSPGGPSCRLNRNTSAGPGRSYRRSRRERRRPQPRRRRRRARSAGDAGTRP